MSFQPTEYCLLGSAPILPGLPQIRLEKLKLVGWCFPSSTLY